MNKDEIKKGLECCCNRDFKTACRNCSYLTCPECNDMLCKDALTLITEYEAEIAQLKADNARLTAKLGQVLLSIDTVKEMTAMCNIDKQNAEIERLKAQQREIDGLKAEDERLREVIRQLNTEYNRAWERLKSDCREIGELKAENKQLKTECALLDDELRIARQDTIDVLNELKEKIVERMGDREYMGVKYKQGVFSESEIDDMIAEVQNAEDKS